jgi:cytochrome c-type biogenesis protein CcmH/NrfG
MDNSKTLVLVVAALFLGLMVGILGPKMFGSKPAVRQVSQQAPAPQQQAPATDYSLQISELKRRLQSNPNDVGLLVQLGNTYFDSSMYPESIEAYEKSLALKPGDPNVLTDLGVMYRRNGQSDEAVKRFRIAAQTDPMHFQSRMNLGVVLFYDFNDGIGAREALEEVLKVSPQGPNADNARQLIAAIDAQQGGK